MKTEMELASILIFKIENSLIINHCKKINKYIINTT